MQHRLAILTVAAAVSAAVGLVPAGVAARTPVQRPAATHHQSAPRAAAITPNGSWTTYHHDDGHTGFDAAQPATVGATAGWTSPVLDDSVYGEPLVYNGLVYVGTLNDTVYALNQSDGTVVWTDHIRAPETTGWACGNVSPQGILGTPVIDTAGGRIYVATFGADDLYRLEGLSLATGALQSSVIITTQALSGFDWTIQQQRGALAIHNGYVYVPFGGRAGDCGAYRGWIFSVPTAGGGIGHYVTPGDGAGFWNSGGVVIDDATGHVFDTSGNGVAAGCAANPDGTAVYENDAIVELAAGASVNQHLGSFYPLDWQGNWCGNDQDLGSASMVLISPTLAFQAGKWGQGFLVNPQSLGGMNGQLYPSPVNYSGADVCYGNHADANFGSYAYAAPYVYLECDGHGLVGLSIDPSTPSFSQCASGACGSPTWSAGGTTTFGPPIVAGGVVWAVAINGGGLYGFSAATGAQVYHSAAFSVNHFSTPSEAGGQVFAAADTQVKSFNLVAGCTSVGDSASPPSPSTAGTAVTVTAVASGCPNPNPLYEFWLLAPGASLYTLAQSYSPSAVLSWSTTGLQTGTYRINVWVKDAGGTGAYGNSYGRWDTYNPNLTYVLTGCSSVSESASPSGGAMRGTTVTITATATGCANPHYEFWILAPGASLYTLAQSYSPAGTYTWSTGTLATGSYRINVWVRDASSGGAASNSYGSWDAYNAGLVYGITAGCPSVSVSAAPPSPSASGTSITFTASAPGCAQPRYEFWILSPGASLYTLVQAYSPTATYTWSSLGNGAGTYRINVWVRDSSSAGTYGNAYGTWDAYNAGLTYRLT